MTFEELLERDGILVYKTKGVSMLPMLHQNRDLVTIEVPDGRLKPLDVALYKRGSSYVLHRVIEVRDGYYLIRGDNTYALEHVPDEDILGVLTGFMRKGKQYSVDDPSYRRYVRVWNAIYTARHAYNSMRGLAYRTAKKLGIRNPRKKRIS